MSSRSLNDQISRQRDAANFVRPIHNTAVLTIRSWLKILPIISFINYFFFFGSNYYFYYYCRCCSINQPPALDISSGRHWKERRRPFSQAGKDNFKSLLINDGAFVDKSLLIRDYLSYNEIVLITRPKGWGKTINLNMLKTFLEIEVDHAGMPVERERRQNGVLFSGGNNRLLLNGSETFFFERLKIADCKFSMSLQGTYPVVYIDWKRVLGDGGYRNFVNNLRTNVRELFDRYRYLKYNGSTCIDTATFAACSDGTAVLKLLIRCPRILTRILSDHFGKRVQMLLDNYDTPLITALSHLTKDRPVQVAINSLEFWKIVRVVRSYLDAALDDNPFLEQAMITGVFPMGPQLTLTRRLQQYTLLDKRFFRYYGFTQTELDKLLLLLLNDYSTGGSSDVLRVQKNNRRIAIRKRFWGYNVSGRMVYNPYSIMNYLRDAAAAMIVGCDHQLPHPKKLEEFAFEDRVLWSATDEHDEKLLLQEKVQDLTMIGTVLADVDDRKRIFQALAEGNAYPLLLFAGHLTPAISDYYGRKIWLKIPNRQVKNYFRGKLIDWRTSRFPLLSDVADKMKLLAEHKFGEFEVSLQEAFACLSVPKKRNDERYYANCMFLLTFVLDDYYVIRRQLQTGLGRADLVLIGKKSTVGRGYGNAIIFEFKMASSPRTLKSKADKALSQIIDRKYDATLINCPYYFHIKNITKIGVAFFDRFVKLMVRVDERPYKIIENSVDCSLTSGSI